MCKLCEINPVYEFTNKRKLCKSCFVRWFEKKFLYTIRKFRMVSMGDKIGYVYSESFRGLVLESLLKMYSEKGNVTLIKYTGKQKINKLALFETSDSIAYSIINSVINFRLKIKDFDNFSPVNKKVIKPLYLFLDKEVLLYAKLKGLRFVKNNMKEDKIISFVNNLETKHPEVKRAVINSYLELFEK